MNGVSDYMNYLIAEKGLNELTIRGYRSVLEKAVQLLPSPITSVTKQDVLDWREMEVEEYEKANGTVNKEMTILKGYLKWLCHNNQISKEQWFDIEKIPRLPKGRQLPKVITLAQVQALFQKVNIQEDIGLRDAVMLFLMYRAGLRLDEVVKVNVDSINKDYTLITLTADMAKGNKEAAVPIDGESFRKCLKYWIEKVRPKHALPNERALLVNIGAPPHLSEVQGTRMTDRNVQIRTKMLMKKAGMPEWAGCHTLRHSRATHLLDAGMDLRYIQEFLRHENIQTTTIYTYVSKAALARKMQEFAPAEEQLQGLNL